MVRKIIKALLAGFVLIPTLSFALGLGDIRLHSGLNQQLNADIDLLSVEPSEVDKIDVKLASYETFAKVGIERSPTLMSLTFKVLKRPDGSVYIKVNSNSPINDPFLDFLVEVNWPSGHILREYTLLLNPPEVTQEEPTPIAAPVTQEEVLPEQPQVTPQPAVAAQPPAVPQPEAAPESEKAAAAGESATAAMATGEEATAPETAKAEETAPPLESTAAEQPEAVQPTPPTPEQVAGAEPSKESAGSQQKATEKPAIAATKPAAAKPSAPAGGELVYGPVRRNETLSQIAKRVRPDGNVSLNQAMIALYQANREAFIDGNINLLRKGAVLRLDDPAALSAISKSEATREVARHNRAWQAYKTKLAAQTPARPETEPAAEQKGSVAASSAAASKEESKLTLVAPSKGGESKQAVGGTGDKGAEVESLRKELMLANETAEAKRKENEDLNKRLKELEGQLDKMQKLLSLKDDNLAAMQQKLAEEKQAQAPSTATKAEAAPAAEMPKPVEPATPEAAAKTPATSELVKPAPEDAEAAPPAAEAATPAATPATAGTPAKAEPSPATTAPATQPTPAPVAKPAPAKPVVAAKPMPKKFPPVQPERSFIDELLDNPMMLGGGAAAVIILILGVILVMRRRRQGRGFQESILTVGATSSMMKGKGDHPASETSFLSDLAVSGMGTSRVQEESDVDPLTEADVYMAYNRFQQAEELLKEGLRHSPERDDLNTKLLEVYYKAKNAKEFELLAESRSSSMQNDSAMWQKVVAMGHELCPDNPLFRGGEGTASETLASSASESAGVNDVFDIGLDLDALSSEMEEAGAGSSDFNVDLGLDFSDLGGEEETKKKSDDSGLTATAEEPAAAEEEMFDFSALSEEMAESQPLTTEPVKEEESLLGDLDFDLSSAAEVTAVEESVSEEPVALDFGDLDLGALAEETPAAEEPSAALDFGDFDLGAIAEETPAEETAPASLDLGDLDLGGMTEGAASGGEAGSDFAGLELGSLAEETSTEENSLANMDFGDLDLGGSEDEGGSFDLSALELDGTSEDGEIADIGDLSDFGDVDDFGSLDEVGTKLDLAKAYVDMGDEEGARGMLEEVIQDGSDEQKRQAQELLGQIA